MLTIFIGVSEFVFPKQNQQVNETLLHLLECLKNGEHIKIFKFDIYTYMFMCQVNIGKNDRHYLARYFPIIYKMY